MRLNLWSPHPYRRRKLLSPLVCLLLTRESVCVTVAGVAADRVLALLTRARESVTSLLQLYSAVLCFIQVISRRGCCSRCGGRARGHILLLTASGRVLTLASGKHTLYSVHRLVILFLMLKVEQVKNKVVIALTLTQAPPLAS